MATSDGEEDNAAARVFNIAELAEMILLELRMKDILLYAMRVCKHWKAIIDNSLKLQQALFFKPLPGSPNLALVKDSVWKTDRKGHVHTIRLNPLWKRHDRAVRKSGLRYRHPRNSYHRMLLTQPPVYSCGFRIDLYKVGNGIKLRHLNNHDLPYNLLAGYN